MRIPKRDVIDTILEHLRQGACPEQAALRTRQEWGGCELGYLRKQHAPQQRTQALAMALQQGQPLSQAFVTAGLPRRSGFRHLTRRTK